MIDVRTLDIESFLAAMQDCEVIVSQSLHGLIFADALGIPNTWLGDWDAPVRGGNNFKFFDYFSSIGRPPYLLTSVTNTGFESNVLKNIYESNTPRIRAVQADVIDAFHEALRSLSSEEILQTTGSGDLV